MRKQIAILGSTGSIGKSTLLSIKRRKDYDVKLLTANKDAKKLLSQAIKFRVKNVILQDKKKYNINKNNFKDKKINVYNNFNNLSKILRKKIDYSINSISGISGLEPTLKIIPFTKNILIANKESIICGWDLINKNLKKYKTFFIPIDSEHYSIWELIKNEDNNNIEKIILTASGGPFLNTSKKRLININPNIAIKHPNWKMGKKISIDSSTMMNKVYEYIEAKKIFKLKKNKISILVHPSSYIHAIIFLKGNIIKLLAHEPKMTIPISNALNIRESLNERLILKNIKNLNELSFSLPNKNKFPLLSVINLIPEESSNFETILITLNDSLVDKYLNGKINYLSITKNLLTLIKSPFLLKYYKLKPKSIYDIKKMIEITKNYLDKNLKHYAK